MDFSFFAGHDSFYLREGWLPKGLTAVAIHKDIFAGNNLTNAIDTLGIGANMVKSLRYWLELCGVIKKCKKGSSVFILTDFGKLISVHDPFCLNKSTIWLLHYYTCQKSPIWEMMFSEEDMSSFDREKALLRVYARVKEEGGSYAKTTIDSSVGVFLNTYLWSLKKQKADPEDNLNSPFANLRLLLKTGDKYNFRQLNTKEIPALLIYLIIFNSSKGRVDNIHLEQAFEAVRGIVKIDLNGLRNALRELEHEKLINVDRAAGLNIITDKACLSSEDIERNIIVGGSA